ncbi:MAG TPA: hypothetical protein VHV51_20265 [Polyangiaceae bacterium]|jgi:hypothetical protein|nr:hypothetical protein [Polyangiaceae bacterium]
MMRNVLDRRLALGVALAACLPCASCRHKPSPVPPDSAPSASSAPVDRLAPDELAVGTSEIWGLTLPRRMHVEHQFPELAYAIGPVTADALANYVRDRVIVSHVEIGAGRTIFPNARIKGGPPDHFYELDVIPEPNGTRLQIQDLTPVKVVPGLSDEERWRQAGLTPQGRPLDMKKFE